MLTRRLPRCAAAFLVGGEQVQGLLAGAAPFGLGRQAGISIRIEQRVLQFVKPVGASEAHELVGTKLETEAPTVRQIELVPARPELRKEVPRHYGGEQGTGLLTHLLYPKLEQVEQRQPAGSGRRPVDDAGKAAILDQKVPTPEVAMVEASGDPGEHLFEAEAKIAERPRSFGEVLSADLRVLGRRSRFCSVEPGNEELGQEVERVVRYISPAPCRQSAAQAPLDGPPGQADGAAGENPWDSVRDDVIWSRFLQGGEGGTLVVDAASGRAERHSEDELRCGSDQYARTAEGECAGGDLPAELGRCRANGSLESGRLAAAACADDHGSPWESLEERDVPTRLEEPRYEFRLGLPGNGDRSFVAIATCRSPSTSDPSADGGSICQALHCAGSPVPRHPAGPHCDRNDRQRCIAHELLGDADLDVWRVIHELSAARRDGCREFGIPDSEATRRDRDDRRQPSEPRMRPDSVVSVLHRRQDATTLAAASQTALHVSSWRPT